MPRLVFTPNALINLILSSVTTALSGFDEIVKASGSTMISLFEMPYSDALAMIFSAIFALSGALSGMPFSSIVKAISPPPYFCTIGKTFFMLSSVPFTEFTNGFPLYILIACSSVSNLVESICKGKSVTACMPDIHFFIMSVSSISGKPTFTSSICTFLSACLTASFST